MALIRRSGARFSANIWPGFVDAMTAILLVLMFVLSIFIIVQSILRDTITGQNSRLAILNFELNEIKNDLGIEKSKLAQLDTLYEEKLLLINQTEETSSSSINEFNTNSKYFKKKMKILNIKKYENFYKKIPIKIMLPHVNKIVEWKPKNKSVIIKLNIMLGI